MKNKEIVRKIIQACLVCILTVVVLLFYQYDTPSFLVKEIVTIVLIVVNCVYSYDIGLKDGAENYKKISETMKEHYDERLNKAIDMIVEERKKNRAVE